MKPIKIVSYNTYLICNRFNKNRVTHPEQRATKICSDFLSNKPPSRNRATDTRTIKPDLCFFQEVWGSGIQELTKNSEYLCPPGRTTLVSSTLPNYTNQIPDFGALFSEAKELLNTAYFHWKQTGGLYDFATPTMTCRYRSKHTFSVSRSKSNKGVEATLWDVPHWENQEKGNDENRQHRKRLLVFNTHLDPWHVANRRAQIGEILEFMEDTLQSIEKIDTPTAEDKEERTYNSFSKTDGKGYGYDWTNTAVLVVGDFNIKAGSTEYWETLECLESMSGSTNSNDCNPWKDYFTSPDESDENNTAQHTYALQNSLAVYPADCGRIDYMFGIQRFGKPPKAIENASQQHFRTFMSLNMVSRSIRKEPIGDESSDHYALVLEVVPEI